MAVNAGTVYFTVDADTRKAIDGFDQIGSSLNETGKEMKELDGNTKQLNTSFSKLATVIKTVIAASALRQAADLVQSYQEMSERVQMATSSTVEFEEVQKRLLKTSNGTYRRLSEAQELYILTADSLRSMGYSTKQAMDVQDSMSYAFVKNATSMERANAAISAFTKSVNTGKVAADQWETIVSAVPSVINDIASATGKTSAEIRALGAAGKLTANQLTEGLRSSLEQNAKAADAMSNNLTDASVRVENALTAVLVKFEQSSGAIQSFTEGVIKAADYVIEFSEDTDGMADVIKSVEVVAVSTAAVITGKLVGAMALYAKEQVNAVASTVQKNNADKLAAQAALRRAAVEKQAAMAVLATAQADATAAKVGTYAHTVAINNLTAARMAAITATKAHAVAQAHMNKVATVGTIAINGLRSAMAFLGGPAGVAFLAATALYTFAKSQRDSANDTDEMTASINGQIIKLSDLKDEYDKLTKAGQERFWSESNTALTENLATQTKLKDKIRETRESIFKNPMNSESDVRKLAELQTQLNETESEYKKIQKVRQAMFKPLDDSKWTDPEKALSNDEPSLTGAVGDVSEGQKAIDKLTESLKLAKLEGRELAQAMSLSGLTSDEVTKYGDEIKRLSGELFDLEQAADNQDAIISLEQDLKLAALSGAELAQAQALLGLNDYATPEQIERVKELSDLLFKAKEMAKFGEDPVSYIRGSVSPLSGGAFDNQFARYAAEEEEERNRYQKQIERLEEAKRNELEVVGGYQALQESMAKEHSARMAQIEQAKNDAILSSGAQLFGSMADMLYAFGGESSKAYQTIFAISKGFAISQAALNLTSAISQAMADPSALTPAQKFANMAQVSAAGASLANQIASVSYAGGRLYGGSVQADGMYRINENGAPEVFNAANGQQYMLPNTRGEVVSNKDASSGGTTMINITVNADGSSSVDGDSQLKNVGVGFSQAVQMELNKSMRQGGALWQYLQRGKR